MRFPERFKIPTVKLTLVVACTFGMFNEPIILADVGNGVFQGFIGHINRQIVLDKQQFVAAETCIQWFYHQLKKPLPRSPVQRLAFGLTNQELKQNPAPNDCQALYPQGLDEARVAFGQTQSALSLSLTFYQFALIGDRNDDGEYDDAELKDVLESVGVFFFRGEEPVQHLAKLNGKFDMVRHGIEFSVLTDGMQRLYQKGYRLTNGDQALMNQVTG